MLTDLQREKLTHYFHVLDFDKNGYVEREDFLAIAENLSILWGVEYESDDFREILADGSVQWEEIEKAIQPKEQYISLEEWLVFADKHIVNGGDAEYDRYINRFVSRIISSFDTNEDGMISQMEYVDIFVGYRIEVRSSAKSFRKLDLDSNGTISKEEMLSAVKQFFKSDDPEASGNWLFGFWKN